MSIKISVDSVKDFLKKISGIRWFLVYNIDENKIIIKSPAVSDYRVSDLIEVSKASKILLEKSSSLALLSHSREPSVNSIYIKLDGEGIEIESFEKNIFLVGIDEKLLNTLPEIFTLVKKGEFIKCNICGKELIFETYSCPRCGRVVPFITRTCPFCEYDLRYKKCPGHGDVIDYRGRAVKREYSLLIPIGILALVSIVFSVLVSSIYPEYRLVLYALGGLIAALLVAIGLIASKPRA